MVPALDDPAPFQDVDAICLPHGGEPVAHQDGCSTCGELSEHIKDLSFSSSIQGTGGFVQHEDLGLPHEGSGQGDFLPLADTQFRAVLEPLAQDRGVALGQSRHDLVGAEARAAATIRSSSEARSVFPYQMFSRTDR